MQWIITDASVSLLWIKHEHEDRALVQRAWRLRKEIAADKYRVIVPFLWKLEIAGALRNFVARKRIGLSSAQRAVKLLLRFADEKFIVAEPTCQWEGLIVRANEWGVSFYDVVYLELAERTGAIFWTADLHLYRQWFRHPGMRRRVLVGWLGYYPQLGVPLFPP